MYDIWRQLTYFKLGSVSNRSTSPENNTAVVSYTRNYIKNSSSRDKRKTHSTVIYIRMFLSFTAVLAPIRSGPFFAS
jgi:hypothetical protein